MTWLAHNWPWILIGYALTSCAAVVGWISLHHIVWALQARRARSVSTRAARPVGNQAVTSSASGLCTHYQVRPRDEGTAPADRAAVLVPGEKHPPLRLLT